MSGTAWIAATEITSGSTATARATFAAANGYAILWRPADLAGALFQETDSVDLAAILPATNGRSRFAGLTVEQCAAAIRATAEGDRNTSLFEARDVTGRARRADRDGKRSTSRRGAGRGHDAG